ncbi:MAG TPA: ABC transporter permease [Holophagaceae bacterium]|nr:ABC transporter permease [Holophagaceae bacterium]
MIHLIEALGAAVRHFLESLGNVARLGWLALKGLLFMRHTQFRAVGTVLKAQIRFTGIHALALVCGSAMLLGAVTLLQAYAQVPGLGPERFTGLLLVAIVIRELGPLLAAVLVIGRSATAIAAELATMSINDEIDALEVHGVDPVQYLLVPRVLGVITALFGLMVFLDFAALLGGFAVASLRAGMPLGPFLDQIQAVLVNRDLVLTLIKVLGFGSTIALLACYYGLRVRESHTEIPQAVTRAVVACLTAVFLVDGFLAAWVYA